MIRHLKTDPVYLFIYLNTKKNNLFIRTLNVGSNIKNFQINVQKHMTTQELKKA